MYLNLEISDYGSKQVAFYVNSEIFVIVEAVTYALTH